MTLAERAKAIARYRRLASSGDGDAAVELRRLEQESIALRQRRDLDRLQRSIRSVDAASADDVGKLARAMKLLHEMERVSYDFNHQSSQVKQVIIIPACAESMEAWGKLSEGVFGKAPVSPVLKRVYPVEEDIEGGDSSE